MDGKDWAGWITIDEVFEKCGLNFQEAQSVTKAPLSRQDTDVLFRKDGITTNDTNHMSHLNFHNNAYYILVVSLTRKRRIHRSYEPGC